MDNVTNAVAATAVSSPFWLPWLQTASEVSAYIAPVLGVIWLAVQIWAKIKVTLERKDEK
jgi:tellurite resistance protein TehA-like permease